MAGLMGDGLQLLDESRRLMGGFRRESGQCPCIRQKQEARGAMWVHFKFLAVRMMEPR